VEFFAFGFCFLHWQRSLLPGLTTTCNDADMPMGGDKQQQHADGDWGRKKRSMP
jgi:hypothetical protein